MHLIGIDLGGTTVKGVLLTDTGDVLSRETVEGTNEAGDGWKEMVLQVFTKLKKAAGSPVLAGLAAPGLPNEKNTRIVYLPERLNGLEEFDWMKFLGQPVVVLNDAHAALMAEATWGAARGFKHVLMLTLGTGIGGGILIDGKLYQGMFQRAGSIGDISIDSDSPVIGITGMPGSLEIAFGNETIALRSGNRFQSTRALVEAAEKGDKQAMEIWSTSVRKLAIGICSLINVLSPEVVILGGGITQAGDKLFGPLAKFMAQYEMRPNGRATPVIKATFSEYSGAIGAACFAMRVRS